MINFSVIILLSIYCSSANEYFSFNKHIFPNPLYQYQYCRRLYPSQFCDPDNKLTLQQANIIDRLIFQFQNSTSSMCNGSISRESENGIFIGIAVVNDLSNGTAEYLKDYAEYLRKEWALGMCEDDLIILAVTARQQIAIAFGNTIQELLPLKIINAKNKLLQEKLGNNNFMALGEILLTYYEEIKKFEKRKMQQNIKKIPTLIFIIPLNITIFYLTICLCTKLFLNYIGRKQDIYVVNQS